MKTKLNIEAFPEEFIESLVYKDNIKTINGNSILGEGDISISQSNNDEILQKLQELKNQVDENEEVTASALNNLKNSFITLEEQVDENERVTAKALNDLKNMFLLLQSEIQDLKNQ